MTYEEIVKQLRRFRLDDAERALDSAVYEIIDAPGDPPMPGHPRSRRLRYADRKADAEARVAEWVSADAGEEMLRGSASPLGAGVALLPEEVIRYQHPRLVAWAVGKILRSAKHRAA